MSEKDSDSRKGKKPVRSFRIDPQLLEIVEKYCEDHHLSFSSFLDLAIRRFLESQKELSLEKRILLKKLEASHYRKLEREAYEEWKAMLRSSSEAHLLKDVQNENRLERIKEKLKDPNISERMKSAILGNLSLRNYYSEKLQEIYIEIGNLINQLNPEIREKILRQILEEDSKQIKKDIDNLDSNELEKLYFEVKEIGKFVSSYYDWRDEIKKKFNLSDEQVDKLIERFEKMGWIYIDNLFVRFVK